MNEAFENMFTEMENSEEMENPNIYCEKFKDDILSKPDNGLVGNGTQKHRKTEPNW